MINYNVKYLIKNIAKAILVVMFLIDCVYAGMACIIIKNLIVNNFEHKKAWQSADNDRNITPLYRNDSIHLQLPLMSDTGKSDH
jgi:hypothetical protein